MQTWLASCRDRGPSPSRWGECDHGNLAGIGQDVRGEHQQGSQLDRSHEVGG